MADLMLKVGDKGPRAVDWKDGDIIHAFNNRRILCCHAQHICLGKNPLTHKLIGLDRDMLLPADHLGRDLQHTTHEYMYEALSETEGRVTRLNDNRQIRFDSNVPYQWFDGRMVHMHVHQFLDRAFAGLRNPAVSGRPMYGSITYPIVWYGGRQDYSATRVSSVWDAIETKSMYRRTDPAYARWPAGTLDLRRHLMVRTDDFDDSVANTLEEQDYDATDPDNPILARRRNFHVDIDADLGLTALQRALTRDRDQTYDDRDRVEHARATIVRRKAAR